MEKKIKILEYLEYWLDKGGKEGLFNHYMTQSRLKDLLNSVRSGEDISQYDDFRERHGITDEDIKELIDSNEF